MKKNVNIVTLICILITFLLIGTYFIGGLLLHFYIDFGANELIKLEKSGKLSREYGYVWQEINSNKEMKLLRVIESGNGVQSDSTNSKKAKVYDLPSLSAVTELNSIKSLNKTIRINDRNGILLVKLEAIHTSLKLSELNEILLKSLLITEDKHFYNRKNAYDYNALLRATINAILISVRTMKLQYPRGSSTIHMQVARFLLMKYDSRGYAFAERSLKRKLKELKMAQALKMTYTNDEILTLYVNHCVSAGRGMLGYHDISVGLFGVTPDKISIPQSLYLARLVKWNRHLPEKIIHQIKSSIPVLAKMFKWNDNEQKLIEQSLDTLTFKQPVPLIPKNGYLIDLANEYWRKICQGNGIKDPELTEMDLADPESKIRRYGNLAINLTIDYRLQKLLEKIVEARGFGADTTIRTDISLGNSGTSINRREIPSDTLRKIWLVNKDTSFFISSGTSSIQLKKGDTVICNIRYKKVGSDTIRRSCYYYKRGVIDVSGQYYSYAIMDSKTNQLLAYCSKDQLGSRLRSLLTNKTQNGSSLAKPIIYALAYDLGIYQPTDMVSDNQEIADTCEWARKYLYGKGNPVGMVYSNVPEKEGYQVRNYGHNFDGYDFLFNHLSNSNNIIAVETIYHLTTKLTDGNNQIQYVKALFERLKNKEYIKLQCVTGPQIYCAIALAGRNFSLLKSKYTHNYSIALGTLELSLYEQMQLFNVLYNNKIVVKPELHPSLFIKKVQLAGSDVPFVDNIESRTIFGSLKSVNPVHLALHKRLISNPADQLDKYDMCADGEDKFYNFAKSGTTDDIIRPFNADVTDTARANYGLWNAVLGLRLTRNNLIMSINKDTQLKELKELPVSYDSVPVEEYLDVTVACIGECNKYYTGERDGKTLHGYVTRELLHAFGVPCTYGFYNSYETELNKEVSDKSKYASQEESDLPFLSRTLIKFQTGIGKIAGVDEIKFERSRFDSGIQLRGKSYRKMLKFAPYMGDKSRYYFDLLNRLKKPNDIKEAQVTIDKINAIPMSNKILKRDVESACLSLLKSIDEIDSSESEK